MKSNSAIQQNLIGVKHSAEPFFFFFTFFVFFLSISYLVGKFILSVYTPIKISRSVSSTDYFLLFLFFNIYKN